MGKWNEEGVEDTSVRFFYKVLQETNKTFFYPTWIGHYQCRTPYNKNRKYYPDFLLGYILKGEFFLNYEDQSYVVRPGEVFLIDCTKAHHYGAKSKNVDFLFLHFNGGNAKEVVSYITQKGRAVFPQSSSTHVGNQLQYLVKLCQRHESLLDVNHFSVAIYEMLLSLNETNYNPILIEEGMVTQAIKYIYENMNGEITLDDLAESAGLSKYYFSHRFKQEIGCSPMSYVRRLRMETAKKMLHTTSLSVGEIAKAVGFDNQNSFSQLFTKDIGISPSAYRKQVH
jgi:AraC-like DNA-binding protein